MPRVPHAQPNTVDPFGDWWYKDGVADGRCKICLALKSGPHDPRCKLGQVEALLVAMSKSPAMMGGEDIERLGKALELIGTPEEVWNGD